MNNIIVNNEMFDLIRRINRIMHKERTGDMLMGEYVITKFTGNHDIEMFCNIHASKAAGGRVINFDVRYHDKDTVKVDASQNSQFNPWGSNNTIMFPYLDDMRYDEKCGDVIRDMCSDKKLSYEKRNRPIYSIDESLVVYFCTILESCNVDVLNEIKVNLYHGTVLFDYNYVPNIYSIDNRRCLSYDVNTKIMSLFTPNTSSSLINLTSNVQASLEEDCLKYRRSVMEQESKSIRGF